MLIVFYTAECPEVDHRGEAISRLKDIFVSIGSFLPCIRELDSQAYTYWCLHIDLIVLWHIRIVPGVERIFRRWDKKSRINDIDIRWEKIYPPLCTIEVSIFRPCIDPSITVRICTIELEHLYHPETAFTSHCIAYSYAIISRIIIDVFLVGPEYVAKESSLCSWAELFVEVELRHAIRYWICRCALCIWSEYRWTLSRISIILISSNTSITIFITPIVVGVSISVEEELRVLAIYLLTWYSAGITIKCTIWITVICRIVLTSRDTYRWIRFSCTVATHTGDDIAWSSISVVGYLCIGVRWSYPWLLIAEHSSVPVFFVVDISTSLYEIKKFLRVVVYITIDIDLCIYLSLLDDDRLKSRIRTRKHETQEHHTHEYLYEGKSARSCTTFCFHLGKRSHG